MIEPRLLTRIETKKAQLNQLRPLPTAAVARLREQILVKWIYCILQYYRVLDQANAGKPAALVNFVGRAVERSLTLYLEACIPVIAAPRPEAEWIPLREAATGTPYSQEYLSLLARTGKIEAVKRGRVWYTTRKAIDEYHKSVE